MGVLKLVVERFFHCAAHYVLAQCDHDNVPNGTLCSPLVLNRALVIRAEHCNYIT